MAGPVLALLAWIATGAPAEEPSPGHYLNPLGEPLEIADPFVLRHDDRYFLYGTSSGRGFRYWTSDDLVDWTARGHAFERDEESWGTGSFWAPEVVRYRDKFCLIYSAKGPVRHGSGLRLCLAVADEPGGPFEDLHAPWFDDNFSCIDAHLFIDEDGTPYLFYEKVGAVGQPGVGGGYLWGRIFGVPLKEDLSAPVAEPTLCLAPSEPWENPDDDFARSTEGMTVFLRDGRYYMTYSANHYRDPDYGIGYATADSPLGPWRKAEANPILAKDLAAGVSGPGHNSVIRSPDGSEWFIVYHTHADAENPSAKRVLNLDRIEFSPQGELRVKGPTRIPQPLPAGAE